MRRKQRKRKMYSPRMVYHAEDELIYQLCNGRKLRCYFSPSTCLPYVDIYTAEDGEILIETGMNHLRVYAYEFERLKTVLMDFINYIICERWDSNDDIKPSVMVPVDVDDPNHSTSNLIVDCSRSYHWLLVRSRTHQGPPERPKTVMDKEKYFPIRIAFHAGDFVLLQDILKLISIFFTKTKESRKMLLLEGRLIKAKHVLSMDSLSEKKPRRVDLNIPHSLNIDIARAKPSGATLF